MERNRDSAATEPGLPNKGHQHDQVYRHLTRAARETGTTTARKINPPLLVCIFLCILHPMRIVWDDAKRRSNLRKHGFDFIDAEQVFSGITYTIEDNRFAYGQQRFLTLGLLRETVVVIAHTEEKQELRIISMRKATRNEQTIYFEAF